MSIYHAPIAELALAHNAKTYHATAGYMFDAYGAHISGEDRDYEIQTVRVEWLKAGRTEAELVGLILENTSIRNRDTAESLAGLAIHVWRDMEAIEDALARAVKAYRAGDLAGCVEALAEAGRIESDHGDDPDTAHLADRLLVHAMD